MQKILFETFTTGYRSLFLYIISFICIFMAIYIIISKNPIFSVLFLIGLFFGVSIYLMIIGLHFIGLSYLLIYVGAVSILFLFILMLINVRISELVTDNKNSIFLAILTIFSFNYFVSDILPSGIIIYDVISEYTIQLLYSMFKDITSSHTLPVGNDIVNLILHYLPLLNITGVSSKSWDSIMVVSSHITSIGNILYTNLFILFIIASLILLLAMVGAIVITINKSLKDE
jgi:NADH-ubiquinone oxidoreductase chain 6